MPGAVLQGLGQVRAGDAFGAFQVGQGAGDLEDAVQGAQGQVQALACGFQPGLVLVAQCTIMVHRLEVENGVRATLPRQLPLAGAGHLRGDLGAAQAAILRDETRGFAAHCQVQVDAVQQRAGELGAVALDLLRGATAAAAGVAQVAAGAGVHRRHQLEARREAHPAVGPGNHDFSPFKR